MEFTTLRISEWEWDDNNLRELAGHGINRRKVLNVVEEAPKFRRNKSAALRAIRWSALIVEVRFGQSVFFIFVMSVGARSRAGELKRMRSTGTTGLDK